ncbi:hypothetical protein PputUW4_01544 [Pseudomonas sp. UW4]|nr:hypothetical protein PputUW4_01544 [Pseudomonas sp. UW4]
MLVECEGPIVGTPLGASPRPQVLSTSARNGSTVRPPSLASRIAAPQRLQKSRAKQIRVPPRSSPLNRPSVSSPAVFDLDPPAPSASLVPVFIRGSARSAVRRSRTHCMQVTRSRPEGNASG